MPPPANNSIPVTGHIRKIVGMEYYESNSLDSFIPISLVHIIALSLAKV
jgi:hypothetical protein